ncbi:propanediol utilization polyhedral body protein PduB [Klebsiella pneumoniae]|uniref:Propanediol utilization polyhedral body protein PduB n=1 Tax=Klebsiella pneumoniae TaxID=573 RepID=A0A447RQ54_KLEPN|nr:propanediol utilization polyhedral body protein PduB [Klebsiella pneumoniae]
MAEKSCSLTEFVGTAIGDTLGLVIANVDAALLEAMKLEKRYRSIGILGARTGAGPHIMAPMKRSKPPTPKWSALSFSRHQRRRRPWLADCAGRE